ncbi:hypothetical protein [Microlunatus ginsengisoli]
MLQSRGRPALYGSATRLILDGHTITDTDYPPSLTDHGREP